MPDHLTLNELRNRSSDDQPSGFSDRVPYLYCATAGRSTWVLLEEIPQAYFCDMTDLSILPHP